MAASSQRLIREQVKMVEFPQNIGNLTEASTNLYELIKGRNFLTYPDEQIRTAISRAVAIESPRGWRIGKEKQTHKIDIVVALGMAALAAVKAQSVPYYNLNALSGIGDDDPDGSKAWRKQRLLEHIMRNA